MSLLHITVAWSCDGCPYRFETQLDESRPVAADDRHVSVYDVAVDSLHDGMTSTEHNEHYCRACTRRRDEGRQGDSMSGDIKGMV